MMNTIITFVVARLREPSTWAGAAVLMQAVLQAGLLPAIGEAVATRNFAVLMPAVLALVAIVRKG